MSDDKKEYREALSRNEKLLIELIDKIDSGSGGDDGLTPEEVEDITIDPNEAKDIFDDVEQNQQNG